jgi:hypothetical protein
MIVPNLRDGPWNSLILFKLILVHSQTDMPIIGLMLNTVTNT